MKRKMNCTEARQVSIIQYLAGINCKPVHIKRGNEYWYSSPMRNEKDASFKVDAKKNVWYDHGSGQGGNIIDLVKTIHKEPDISKVLEILSNRNNSFSFHPQPLNQFETATSITIKKIKPLTNIALLQYLEKRCIDVKMAQQYCEEIYYQAGTKNYFSVGFKNDGGGYELRNTYFKNGVSPKTITTLNNGKNCIAVFEGFMDFLSFLTLYPNEKTKLDFIILNSVANMEKAINGLQKYDAIYLYLDNDTAGNSGKEKILKAGFMQVIDRSVEYKSYKDVNEWLMNKRLPVLAVL